MKGHWLSAAAIATSLTFAPVTDAAQLLPHSGIGKPVLTSNKQSRGNFDSYILGPGDGLFIELYDIPELSSEVTIGPDGTIYLPRLRALYVEGLTIEELRLFLTQQFKTYVREPEIYIRPVKYRPIRVYVGGEIKRPGFYTIRGVQNFSEDLSNKLLTGPDGQELISAKPTNVTGGSSSRTLFPTLFDAIQSAQGITPFTDLSNVQVTRRQPASSGGGRIRTNLNFLSLITTGDESQNIRLFDGDVVNVARSPVVLREQLLKAGQTNLTPQFMQVYVSGRVESPGPVTLPQGSSLVQAVDLAGGTKLLHGKVEFIRFTREGTIDRRIFGFKRDSPADDYRNPVLMSGDVIRMRESLVSAGIKVLNEITAPAVGLYSVYSIYRDLQP